MVCFKFLGVAISEDLKWIANAAAIITKKVQFPQNTEEDLRVCKSVFLLLLNRQHPDVLYNCLGWEQLSSRQCSSP